MENKKYICICGSKINLNGLERHKKTKKHLKYIEKYNDKLPYLEELEEVIKDFRLRQLEYTYICSDYCLYFEIYFYEFYFNILI